MRKLELFESCAYPYENIADGREQAMYDAITALYELRSSMTHGRFLRLLAAFVARIGFQGNPGPSGAALFFGQLLALELDEPSLPDFERGNGP